MKQYIVRRIGYCLLSLFLLSLTIFFFVRVTGDPATLQIFSCDVLFVNVTIDSFDTSFSAAGRTATVAAPALSDDD